MFISAKRKILENTTPIRLGWELSGVSHISKKGKVAKLRFGLISVISHIKF